MNIGNNKYKSRLKSIKKGVERAFDKGKSASWRNRDFEDLSFEINKATRVLISAATLKRIFGKNKTSETYYPQESTLEAMEKYAVLNKSNSLNNKLHLKKIIVSGVPLIVLVFGLLVLFFYTKKPDKTNSFKAEITLIKTDGANPATAFFEYSSSETNDSLFVSFGDQHPLKYLPKNKNKISHYYRHPGIFDVKIHTRDQVVSDTLQLYIPTKGWEALAYYFKQSHEERYFPVPLDLVTQRGIFHPTRKNLASIGMDTTQIVVLRLDNFKETKSNGDNFKLKTRIKNVNYWPAIRCYSAYIMVFGNNGQIILKITNEGCSQFGEFQLSEKTAYGSDYDLTDFSIDIKNWNDIEIFNKNKNVTVSINNKMVFNESYLKSIGDIVGVSLQFHGSGFVDFFELMDNANSPLFQTDLNSTKH